MIAEWNGREIARSAGTVVVEGNHYFPPAAVDAQFLTPSDSHTKCYWKGEASYYTLAVDGATNPDAAWYYPEPFDAAANIKDYIAFWKGVEVREV
ncbi:DUF427 domain-containing protein [Nocardia stercoris]|uniref:DUF427 domain-containing protein n=2 Tax=Nocardia stercoris TaxID=2483361 RepID=A0A3M2L6R8_9NOCA|nr:DUF427 domain-containing protein [Nocardia stercoris]